MSKKQKLKTVLQILSTNQRRPTAKQDSSALQSLSKALGKTKYPKLVDMLDSASEGSEVDLGQCTCTGKLKAPVNSLDQAIDLFRGMFEMKKSQNPVGHLSRAEGGPDQLHANNVKLCIELDAIINDGSMELYEKYTNKLLEVGLLVKNKKECNKPQKYDFLLVTYCIVIF